MMERYAAMGTELVHTYIGGLKALDRALDRAPPPQFDTTGLGYALSPEFRTGPSAGAGASPRLAPTSAVYGYGAGPGAEPSGYASSVGGERVREPRDAGDPGNGRAGPRSRAWESAAATGNGIDGPRGVYSRGIEVARYGYGIPPGAGGARDPRGYGDDLDSRRLGRARSGRGYVDDYWGYSGSGRSRGSGGYARFGIPDSWGYGSGSGAADDYRRYFRRSNGWGGLDRGGYIDPEWGYGGYTEYRYDGYGQPGYGRYPGPGYHGYAAPGYDGYAGSGYGGYAAPGYGGYAGPGYGGYPGPGYGGYGGYEAPGYGGYGPDAYGPPPHDVYHAPADGWGYQQPDPPTEEYRQMDDEQAAERVDNGVPARPAPHQPGILPPPEERLRRPWLND